MRTLVTFATALGFMGLVSLAQSQQPETAVQCNEDVRCEPIALRYGEHIEACKIDSITETDQFTFEGQAGDRVRITATAVNLSSIEPRLEVIDPHGRDIPEAKDTNCRPCSVELT